MATLKVRYLVAKPRSGGVRYYWQPHAELVAVGFRPRRLPDELAAALAAAEGLNAELDAWRAGAPAPGLAARPAPGTLDALIALFKADERHWARLSPATQRSYGQALGLIAPALGHLPVARFDHELVDLFYDAQFRRAPAFANLALRVLRRVLFFGVRKGWLAMNPAAKPGMIGLAPRQSLWSPDALAAFVAAADAEGRASIGTAVVLAGNLAQRQGDVLRLHWNQLALGRFRFRQRKTGQAVDVPCSAALTARLAGCARSAGPIVVSEETGAPYRSDNFRHLFARLRAVAAAGLPGADGWPTVEPCPGLLELWFMDLRRTGMVELAEAGATLVEIAAVSGHSIERTRQILETYLVRTSAMATAAIAKLDARRALRP